MKNVKKIIFGTLLLVGVSLLSISLFATQANQTSSSGTINVKIDRTICVGCGACVEASNDDIFELSPDTGTAFFSINVDRRVTDLNVSKYYNVSWLHSDDVEDAIAVCPVGAIEYF